MTDSSNYSRYAEIVQYQYQSDTNANICQLITSTRHVKKFAMSFDTYVCLSHAVDLCTYIHCVPKKVTPKFKSL